MARVRPVEYTEASPEVRAAYDHAVREHGRITNMKRTLLRSRPAFDALMEWYTLRDVVEPFLGERLVNLLSHAISAENECLICSTFFRRILDRVGGKSGPGRARPARRDGGRIRSAARETVGARQR